jgi:predicted transcriptional regulator
MTRPAIEIPPAELEVLGALWRLGTGTVRQVLEDLEGRGRRLAYTTVLTLLGRLEARGCVQSRKAGQARLYRPRVSRDRILSDRLGSLVRELGEGRATPLILHLVKAHRLSEDDIEELKGILRDIEPGADDDPGGAGSRRGKRP